MKSCNKCHQTLDVAAFAKNRSKSDGLSSWCKACNMLDWQTRYVRKIRKPAQFSTQRARDDHYQRAFNAGDRSVATVRYVLTRLLVGARTRARQKGIPFAISLSDVALPIHCPALHIPLQIGRGILGPASPTLDRFDPTVGYIPGNVTILSLRANMIKSNARASDVRKVADWYATTTA